jgi:hypothetical protein
MPRPLTSKFSIADGYGRLPGNITIEDAQFWGRPNFAGEIDRFKNTSRTFNVILTSEVAEELRRQGWLAKTLMPRNDEEEELSFLKVNSDFWFTKGHEGDMDYEQGPDIWIIQGEQREKLTSKTCPLLDKARFEVVDMEIRPYEWDKEDNPGRFTARLQTLVAVMRPNMLSEKYGNLA